MVPGPASPLRSARPLWLLALRGFPGSGKSSLAGALSRALRWPLGDKDDVKDILHGQVADADGLSYRTIHITSWPALEAYRRRRATDSFRIAAPLLVVDSTRPLPRLVHDTAAWLERLQADRAADASSTDRSLSAPAGSATLAPRRRLAGRREMEDRECH